MKSEIPSYRVPRNLVGGQRAEPSQACVMNDDVVGPVTSYHGPTALSPMLRNRVWAGGRWQPVFCLDCTRLKGNSSASLSCSVEN